MIENICTKVAVTPVSSQKTVPGSRHQQSQPLNHPSPWHQQSQPLNHPSPCASSEEITRYNNMEIDSPLNVDSKLTAQMKSLNFLGTPVAESTPKNKNIATDIKDNSFEDQSVYDKLFDSTLIKPTTSSDATDFTRTSENLINHIVTKEAEKLSIGIENRLALPGVPISSAKMSSGTQVSYKPG